MFITGLLLITAPLLLKRKPCINNHIIIIIIIIIIIKTHNFGNQIQTSKREVKQENLVHTEARQIPLMVESVFSHLSTFKQI